MRFPNFRPLLNKACRLRGIKLLFLIISITSCAHANVGQWHSSTTGSAINFKITDSSQAEKDFNGHYPTVVYLENLAIKKIGGNQNSEDVAWLLSKGYRVVELDYKRNANSVSPLINADIIAINDSIEAGSFCGLTDCSHYRSYVLFEGYRIARDVPYFVDDPSVYNWPAEYTEGDSLHMDIIYPANASVEVPVVLSFSYSNSYASWDSDKQELTAANRDQRLKLGYSLAGFNDSFLEGAPANGIAWAMADHPKYCSWGKGKPSGGANDTYKSYMVNPDAAQKVKSAIRTLRALGKNLGLNGEIGIYGFSRGSDAGSMAIGDRVVPAIEKAGFHQRVDDQVQVAALGPGVFDFTKIYNTTDDGDKNLEGRCPWAWGPLDKNYERWEKMGSSYLVEGAQTAPVLFFYNTDDAPYYQEQIAYLKAKLDSLEVPNSCLIDYGHGHAVPQKADDLKVLYDFFSEYLHTPSRN